MVLLNVHVVLASDDVIYLMFSFSNVLFPRPVICGIVCSSEIDFHAANNLVMLLYNYTTCSVKNEPNFKCC